MARGSDLALACLIHVGMKRLMTEEDSGLGIGPEDEEVVRMRGTEPIESGNYALGEWFWPAALRPRMAVAAGFRQELSALASEASFLV